MNVKLKITLLITALALPALGHSSLLRCSLMPQHLAPVGAKCITTKSQIFTKVVDSLGQVGWQDSGPNGKIWAELMVSNLDGDHAADYCLSFEQETLPTQSDFEVAETHGIRELFKDMAKKFFWSSTPVYNCPECRYEFSGVEGKSSYFDMKDHHYDYDSARCLISN